MLKSRANLKVCGAAARGACPVQRAAWRTALFSVPTGMGRAPFMLGLLICGAGGCFSPGDRARLVQENEGLRREVTALQRTVAARDAAVARLDRQVENLVALGPDRPAALFAPVSLEIAQLSSGADYDGQPGDDGVTVYLRPRDAMGDVVKVPGRIRIQLLDNTDLRSPRPIGVYEFNDPRELNKLWYSRFMTAHYTLRCPFPPGARLPDSRKLLISAEFVDFLTGSTLTTSREVRFSLPEAAADRGRAAPPG